jgi:DNA polymerase III subunit delta
MTPGRSVAAHPYTRGVADLKSAYLVCGDDDTKIDSWRARVRARAEADGGPGALETFDAAAVSPEEVAAALATLTFGEGTRYLLVDGAGAWKASQLDPLEQVLGDMTPHTVLVLVVRGKALKQLVKAVEAAGGEVRECPAPKPWELPRWVGERGRELGLQLDQETAKALVTVVGASQPRLERELEKIALALHPRTNVTLDDVKTLAAGDASPQAYELADSLVAGDLRATLDLAEELRTHDERPGRLVFPVVRRLREVHRAAALLERGLSEQQVGKALKAPPWLAKRTVAKAKKADRQTLERAVCAFADLEVELRGGGDLDDDSAFSLTLARAAG